MRGPGKYDDALTVAREMCGSDAAILIVARGDRGGGFSAQVAPELLINIPKLLRDLADAIEEDLKGDAQPGD